LIACAALGGASLMSFLAGDVLAQGKQRPERPEPSFGAIGADLGLSAQEVAGCFPRPAPTQGRAKAAQPEMRDTISCLMALDVTLSGEQIVNSIKTNAPDRSHRGG
jgi:hypothetical protein